MDGSSRVDHTASIISSSVCSRNAFSTRGRLMVIQATWSFTSKRMSGVFAGCFCGRRFAARYFCRRLFCALLRCHVFPLIVGRLCKGEPGKAARKRQLELILPRPQAGRRRSKDSPSMRMGSLGSFALTPGLNSVSARLPLALRCGSSNRSSGTRDGREGQLRRARSARRFRRDRAF